VQTLISKLRALIPNQVWTKERVPHMTSSLRVTWKLACGILSLIYSIRFPKSNQRILDTQVKLCNCENANSGLLSREFYTIKRRCFPVSKLSTSYTQTNNKYDQRCDSLKPSGSHSEYIHSNYRYLHLIV
jgi:hypothetical protein